MLSSKRGRRRLLLLLLSVFSSLFALSVSCPTGSDTVVGHKHYYKVEQSGGLGWNDYATGTGCPTGTKLATWETQEEWDALNAILTGTVYWGWTALHNPNGVSCSTAASCASQLQWHGQPYEVTEAQLGYMDQSFTLSGGNLCMYLWTLKVHQLACTYSTAHALCMCDDCPSGYDSVIENKFFYTSTSTDSWTNFNGGTGCPTGTALATFESQSEFDAVQAIKVAAGGTYIWTALYNPDKVACSGTGCANVLQWGGQTFAFTTDHASYPTLFTSWGSNDDCAVLNDAGDFLGISCSATGLKAACMCLEPIHGAWSAWTDTSTCTLTCGSGGTLQQARSCDNPVRADGGADCVGAATQTVSCNEITCIVNGAWSSWSDPSSCSTTCGSGSQQQTRTCNNPAPSNGGTDCSGSTVQTISCNLGACPVDGAWSDWIDGACSVTCGPGTMTRTRTCTNPSPANGGASCSGDAAETGVTCNIGNCPINGQWSDWMDGACSVSCNAGTMTQTRTCTNPAPQHGGADCSGISSQSGKSCFLLDCPVDGGWTDWVDGTCSHTCDPGTMTQTRTCTNPSPQFNGNDCVGDTSQSGIPCLEFFCPIDGIWSGWVDDPNGCPVTCGGGLLPQTRTCDNPVPAYGGLDCPDISARDIDCETDSCPPEWNDWGVWSSCSVTCDYGTRQRTRTCTEVGQCTGLGLAVDTDYCTMSDCDVNIKGTGMVPYQISSFAKDDFLAGTITSFTPSVLSKPKLQCIHKCLSLRSHRNDYASCNTFIWEVGMCRLGYVSPNWIVEQTQTPSADAIIYTDLIKIKI